jgi:coenzyme F420-0:L-glutamate ligase / coenzyme F420-1:gamma-L-glutamate ligase
MGQVVARAIDGLGEIEPGDDLAELILATGAAPQSGEIVVVAHKAVSKVEGRTRCLNEIQPTPLARGLAAAGQRDPRHVQAVLDETAELVRAKDGVLICRTEHGFVCANAGVDVSNTAAADTVLLLPLDPDASARGLRARLRELTGAAPAVLITDSFGRAWRHGQCDVAIGVAGLEPLADWRGRSDRAGRDLAATWIAMADQIAAAADLTRTKDSGQPVVIVSGLDAYVTAADGPGAAATIRPEAEDMFR